MATVERKVNRKARRGVVVSSVNDKTVIVAVSRAARHRLYRKVIRQTKRYAVHDPDNRASVGDLVTIEETRPISKTKRWRLAGVLTEREVAEVAPETIDSSLVDEVQRSAARAAAEAEPQPEDAASAEAEPPAEDASDAETGAETEPTAEAASDAEASAEPTAEDASDAAASAEAEPTAEAASGAEASAEAEPAAEAAPDAGASAEAEQTEAALDAEAVSEAGAGDGAAADGGGERAEP